MHFLITNDDGIRAEGLRQLVRAALAKGHRVTVCAPDRERSAVSHALSISGALHVREVDVEGARGYETDGTPADCARLGVYLLRNDAPDLVISGINRGPNLGGACIYSGTVNAAMEASMSGTPALAASLCAYNTHEYAAAAKLAVRVAEWMLAHPLPRGALYNLNVPALPYEEIRGVRAAKLASTYLDSPCYVETDTAEGRLYSYIHGVDSVAVNDPETDVMLTRAGYASLTQLTWDMRLNAPDPDPSDIEL